MSSRLLPEMQKHLFCKKLLAAALCVLVVLPEPGSARSLWKRALLKMTEKYDVSRAGGLGGCWPRKGELSWRGLG